MYVDTADLLLHPVRVHLAHVTASVAFLHLANVELPHPALVIVRHAYPRVMRHHSVVQGEYRLILGFEPPNLER